MQSVKRPLVAALTFAALAVACTLAAPGCADTGRAAVPSGAEELTTGRGGVLKATAPRAGRAYVLDRGGDRLVWSGDVVSGDKVTVDPEANRVALNGKTVGESDLKVDRRYTIYFHRPGD